jgi:dTDP-glucose 4,6-dehydratase
MNLLITGGLGFIGSNFIQNILTSTDHNVTNLDKIGLGANIENLKSFEGHPNYNFIKVDIAKKKSISDILDETEVVINFAAETHVDRSIHDPLPFLESNYYGTYNLLDAERKADHPIKHIQISTDEVYGDVLEGSFTEESPLKTSNPYSATKAAADLLCHSYHRTYGMNIITTRCTNNFGPNQFPEKLIPKTIIRALNNLPIPIYGTGKNIRDWLYVQDHCEAIQTVFEKGKSGEVYNISSGNEKTVLEIVKLVLNHLGKPESLMTFVVDRPGHDLRYSLNSSKIQDQLGWHLQHSFEESIIQTIEWYVNNPEWWKPLLTDNILASTPWKN